MTSCRSPILAHRRGSSTPAAGVDMQRHTRCRDRREQMPGWSLRCRRRSARPGARIRHHWSSCRHLVDRLQTTMGPLQRRRPHRCRGDQRGFRLCVLIGAVPYGPRWRHRCGSGRRRRPTRRGGRSRLHRSQPKQCRAGSGRASRSRSRTTVGHRRWGTRWSRHWWSSTPRRNQRPGTRWTCLQDGRQGQRSARP